MTQLLSPEDKMIKARVQLLLNHPFFGYFLTHLRFKSTRSLTPTAAVEYDRRKSQYLDFMYYNPEFVSKLSTNEVMGLQIHEMLHILLQQEQRRGEREAQRWYIASEFAVNSTALKSGFTLPGETDENLRGLPPDEKTEGKSTEEIYDLLPPSVKVETPAHVICVEECGKEEDESESKEEGEGRASSSSYIRESEPKEHQGNAVQGAPKLLSQKELKSIISEAVAYAKMYGRMPAGLELFVDDLLTPKANWREILWRYIAQEFITDYAWVSPNRRYVQHGIYLPGVVREGLELVVCVDTSGSIDKNTLSEFFAEIKGILSSYENVRAHLIECDADVTEVYEISDRGIEEIRFKGGGGTDFTPALDKAAELNPRVCVYLTDGQGEFPKEGPSFPVIWALTNREAKVPFGVPAVIE